VLTDTEEIPSSRRYISTTSGRKIALVNPAFAKAIIKDGMPLEKDELLVAEEYNHRLLFKRLWDGTPWKFWLSEGFDDEKKEVLEDRIQVSIKLCLPSLCVTSTIGPRGCRC
jgi:hypothetical protein